MKKITFALLFYMFSISKLIAQATTLSGTVTEGNAPLAGATISVDKSRLVTTASDGSFSIQNISNGNHRLSISYIGYQNLDTTIVISGTTFKLPALVLLPARSSQGVVVYGSIAKGELKALNLQRASNRIVNIIAADAIGKLPDRNAAEAVQRVPGVSIERDQGEGRFVAVRGLPAQWSASTLNGDRIPTAEEETVSRATAFDFFPTELISQVEVSKAITPDMEGDAMGGNVNFITKTAPDKKTLLVTLGSGYNFKADKPMYSGSLLWGNRSKNGKWGYLVNGSIWNRNWATDNFETRGNPGISRLELRDYTGRRRTIGFNGAVEYKPNSNNRFFVRGLYGTLNDDETHYKMRFRFDRFNATNNTIRVEEQNIHNILITELAGGELGGENKLSNNLAVSWKLSSYTNTFHYGDVPNKDENAYLVVQFNHNNVPVDDPAAFKNAMANFNIDGGKETKDFISSHIRPGFELSPANFNFSTIELYRIRVQERDKIVAQANLKQTVSKKLELKYGAKFRSKERTAFFADDFYIWNGTGAPKLSDVATMPHPNAGSYLSERGSPYALNNFPSVMTGESMDGFWDRYRNNLRYDSANSANIANGAALTRNFNVMENQLAGYAMATWNPSEKITIVGGVRVEHADVTVEGYSYNAASKVASRITRDTAYTIPLPMLHVKISPDAKSNIRFAATRTFVRPDFGSIAPGATYVALDDRFFVGNPSIKPTTSWNFDAMAEYYPGKLGAITAGVFYKSIQDIVVSSRSIFPTYNGRPNVVVVQDQNSGNGWLWGAEFAFNKKFDFLPGFLKGLGATANYTLMRSQMKVNGRAVRIPRQANSLFNVAAYYEYKGFSVRMALNYKGAFIVNHDATAETDEYYGNYTSMDGTATWQINKYITFFAEANNLLNKPLKYYYGTPNRPSQVEYYGIRGQAGIKASIF